MHLQAASGDFRPAGLQRGGERGSIATLITSAAEPWIGIVHAIRLRPSPGAAGTQERQGSRTGQQQRPMIVEVSASRRAWATMDCR